VVLVLALTCQGIFLLAVCVGTVTWSEFVLKDTGEGGVMPQASAVLVDCPIMQCSSAQPATPAGRCLKLALFEVEWFRLLP
jgi:hypothetical protein